MSNFSSTIFPQPAQHWVSAGDLRAACMGEPFKERNNQMLFGADMQIWWFLQQEEEAVRPNKLQQVPSWAGSAETGDPGEQQSGDGSPVTEQLHQVKPPLSPGQPLWGRGHSWTGLQTAQCWQPVEERGNVAEEGRNLETIISLTRGDSVPGALLTLSTHTLYSLSTQEEHTCAASAALNPGSQEMVGLQSPTF